MQTIRRVAISAVCLLFTSCAFVAVPVSAPSGAEEVNRAEGITVGVTTKAEVLDWLGPPDKEVGYFEYRGEGLHRKWCAAGLGLYFIPFAGCGEEVNLEWARISFDEHDVVNCVITSRDSTEKQPSCHPYLDEAFKHWARPRVAQGDLQAAIGLALKHDDFVFVETLASDIDVDNAYRLFKRLDLRPGREREALRWLCRAANRRPSWSLVHGSVLVEYGVWSAMESLARWHATDKVFGGKRREWLRAVGIEPDDAVTLMWKRLMTEDARTREDPPLIPLWQRMSSDDIARGEQMARDWQPGDCPSPMHRIEPGY